MDDMTQLTQKLHLKKKVMHVLIVFGKMFNDVHKT